LTVNSISLVVSHVLRLECGEWHRRIKRSEEAWIGMIGCCFGHICPRHYGWAPHSWRRQYLLDWVIARSLRNFSLCLDGCRSEWPLGRYFCFAERVIAYGDGRPEWALLATGAVVLWGVNAMVGAIGAAHFEDALRAGKTSITVTTSSALVDANRKLSDRRHITTYANRQD
jgi:hypothetical protein